MKMEDLDISKLFMLKDKSETKQSKEAIEEAERIINMTGDIARRCLTYDDFKLYRDQYIETEARLINILINYTKAFVENPGGDVTKYALTNVRLLTRIQDIRSLLRSIELDAKKDKPKPEEQQKADA